MSYVTTVDLFLRSIITSDPLVSGFHLHVLYFTVGKRILSVVYYPYRDGYIQ